MTADIVEIVIAVAAAATGLCGLYELYVDRKERMRTPFDWAQWCPDLRQASHVRLTKKGTRHNDDHGDTAAAQSEEVSWPPFVWAGYVI